MTPRVARVAFGFKTRTGRAILIAVAGDVLEPRFIERSQIRLLPEGAWAPYHAAEALEPAAARESVEHSIATAHRLAADGIRDAVRRLAAAGHMPCGCAVLVVSDPLFYVHRTRIADLAAKARLPAMYGLRGHVDAGGLLAYAANYADLYRRGALYVAKILKGAKPADLPVEQPTRFELVINAKTAKALGRTIPYSVLLRADEVIQ